MKLFLIRHAESEHNIAGLLAGATDSKLTNHGVLQTQRLGEHLVADRGLTFTHIFTSDLQRAYMTADAIRNAHMKRWENERDAPQVEVVRLMVLRERDFGSLECVPWASKRDTELGVRTKPILDEGQEGFVSKETTEAMMRRVEVFMDDYLTPLLAFDAEEESSVAVFSHGLILNVLWRQLIARFRPSCISLGLGVGSSTTGRPLEYLPVWGNTGFMELDITRCADTLAADQPRTITNSSVPVREAGDPPKVLVGWKMVIRTANGKEHLHNLKRTRGGVGSATFDARQRSLDGFFKKPKTTTHPD